MHNERMDIMRQFLEKMSNGSNKNFTIQAIGTGSSLGFWLDYRNCCCFCYLPSSKRWIWLSVVCLFFCKLFIYFFLISQSLEPLSQFLPNLAYTIVFWDEMPLLCLLLVNFSNILNLFACIIFGLLKLVLVQMIVLVRDVIYGPFVMMYD